MIYIHVCTVLTQVLFKLRVLRVPHQIYAVITMVNTATSMLE
jgi:hypothetical protein